jgi:endonuclease YncB( thermonuclease family)
MMDSIGAADHKVKQPGPRLRGLHPSGLSILCLAVLTGVGTAAAGPLSSPGCMHGGEAAEVASATPDFGLKLADGRDILLAGIDPWRPADDPAVLKARRTLASWLDGRPVLVKPLSAQPDRWGRLPALAFAATPRSPNEGTVEEASVSVGEALIAAGLARARPDARVGSCWPTFLAQERDARRARLGLWAEARYSVIAANDRARLLASTGSMAIVKGQIVRVVESRARTYLAFGNHGRDDFALSVPGPLLAKWRASGTDPVTWKDRDVEARGFLDDRFGLQIELSSVDQIEFTAPQ